MSNNNARLDSIQALRGIAALMVVFFHLKEPSGIDGYSIISRLFVHGEIGVDIFFVISGFIMVLSTNAIECNYKSGYDFFIRRFFRIWPLYVITAFAWRFFNLEKGWIPNVINSDFLKSLFFLPTQSGTPSYAVGWTLDIEIVFYLIFAISIFFKNYRWIFLLATAILICLAQAHREHVFGFLTNYGDFPVKISYRILNPHFLEFYVGILLGILYPIIKKINRSFAIPLIAVFTTFFIWQYSSEFKAQAGFYGWGIGCSALFIATVLYGEHFKTPRVLVWLGSISYSLYLLHVVSFYFMGLILERYLGLGSQHLMGPWYFAFYLSSLLFLSTVSQNYIEMKASNAIRAGYKKYSQKLFCKIRILMTRRTQARLEKQSA